MDGTISENIARFGMIDPEKVVPAAQTAGIHEMILHLPEGYETRLVGNGQLLSVGQRQRVGIARAMYSDPRVIVLDEPNSNLDQAGEAALIDTLVNLKKKGATVIIITHRSNILSQVDKIAMLVNGQVAFYGPRDEALALLAKSPQKSPPPTKGQTVATGTPFRY